MVRRIILPLLILLSHNVRNAWTQDSAGQAGEFMRWGVGARALGLGRAYTSLANDASALYWNPAGLAALNEQGGSFMFMYARLTEDASFNYIGIAVPLRLFFVGNEKGGAFENILQNLNIGVGRVWLDYGSLVLYNDFGKEEVGGGNTSDQSAFYFSFSYPFNGALRWIPTPGFMRFFRGDLNIGFTSKLISHTLLDSDGSATSFDLGFRYTHASNVFSLGFMHRDFNESELAFGGDVVGDRIPASSTMGLSISPPNVLRGGLLLSMDYGIVTPGRRERDVSIGAELDFSVWKLPSPITALKVRGGANLADNSVFVGASFSFEKAGGKDWLPQGGVANVNRPDNFGAIQAYSMSLDFNPFTACYWYKKGMNLFEEMEGLVGQKLQGLVRFNKFDEIKENFEKALHASNPSDETCRFSAALRLGDVEFFAAISDNLKNASSLAGIDSSGFKRALQYYQKVAPDQLQAGKDRGKKESDVARNGKSTLFWTQALIAVGQEAQAIDLCDQTVYWEIHQHSTDVPFAKSRQYLKSLALYRSDAKEAVERVIGESLQSYPIAQFLGAKVKYDLTRYDSAEKGFDALLDVDTRYPENVFLPLSEDRDMGDDALILKASSSYLESTLPVMQALGNLLNDVAKVPRFYPDCDLTQFLLAIRSLDSRLNPDGSQNSGSMSLMNALIESLTKARRNELAGLSGEIEDAYIRAFADLIVNAKRVEYFFKRPRPESESMTRRRFTEKAR